MRIVDAHVHFFSRPFFEALATLSPQPGTVEERLARVAQQTGLELPSADVGAHTERWVRELDRAGVARMVAFASLPQEAPAVAQAVALAPERLIGLTLVDPQAAGACERLERWLETGAFRGALVFPALHHFDISGEKAHGVLQVLERARGVCVVHCGLFSVPLRDRLGLPRTYDLRFADPLAIVPAASAFPEVHFVIPHFGAGFLRETLMAGVQCENVYVDTSSSNSWLRTQPSSPSLRDTFARALDVFGPRRILFGTDSSTFPAGWRAERLVEQRGILEELLPDLRDRDLVLGGNAERLYGSGPASVQSA